MSTEKQSPGGERRLVQTPPRKAPGDDQELIDSPDKAVEGPLEKAIAKGNPGQSPQAQPKSPTENLKRAEVPPANPRVSQSPSSEEDAVIRRFRKMKATKRKKRIPEDYRDTVITLQERLTAAIKADRECVMQGKFGGEKLKLMPKLVEKLSNGTLCKQFLNMQGLDLMGQMIYKFPNGEYPSASTRNKVLKMVLKMPVEKEHIMKTKLGGFLTFLEKRKEEIAENKKLASAIKRKWTRTVLGENIDYTMLQNEQHELKQAYLKKRSLTESLHSQSSKRRRGALDRSDSEENDGLQQRKNFRRTSYNFIIMPKNSKMKKNLKRLKEGQRMNKKMEDQASHGKRKRRGKRVQESSQGMDVGEDTQGLDVGDS